MYVIYHVNLTLILIYKPIMKHSEKSLNDLFEFKNKRQTKKCERIKMSTESKKVA